METPDVLNPWKGKFWRMWQVACADVFCDIEDQVGSNRWQPTGKEAEAYFREHGWRKREGYWYCRRHA